MKLQKIRDIHPTLPLSEYDFLQKYRESFVCSELGRIYAQLPLKEMAAELSSHFPKRHPQGNRPMFPREGEIALMFLKSYTGLSDDGLVEMLNGNILNSRTVICMEEKERRRKDRLRHFGIPCHPGLFVCFTGFG